MNVQRIVARVFVAVGGVFWAVVSLFTAYDPVPQWRESGWITLGLLALAVAVFVLSMFYEQLAGLLLIGGGAGVAVYGIVTGWNGGEWVLYGVTLVVPLLVAGALFLLAARMQNICELSESASPTTPATTA